MRSSGQNTSLRNGENLRLPPLTSALAVPEEYRTLVVANYCVGLSPIKSYYAAGLSDEDMESLEGDPAFQRLLEVKRAEVTSIRATQLDRLAVDNIGRGISKELIKVLEILDPEDFSPRAALSVTTPEIPAPVVTKRGY